MEVSCANSTLEITNTVNMSIEKSHKTAILKKGLIKDIFDKTEEKRSSKENLLKAVLKLESDMNGLINKTNTTLVDVSEVLENAQKMKESNHNQDDLRNTLDLILGMSHVSNLNDIKNLSEAITKIASSVKNISKILEETGSKREKADDLLQKAKEVR